MATRNVTLNISDEAHFTARLWAAHYDVPVSALIAAFLEGLPTNPAGPRVACRIHQQRANARAALFFPITETVEASRNAP